MRRWALAPLLLCGLPAAARAAPAAGTTVVESAHYALLSEGPRPEAEDLSRLLEAAWAPLTAHFGAAPELPGGARLHVGFHETSAGASAAVKAAGGSPPAFDQGVGGYYDPVSRGAYCFRQPSAWYTRTLLLHEAIHQFHYLAVAGNRSPSAGWYVEGLAEHLSHHTWDGTTLALGVVPLLSLEDRPARALDALADPAFDLEALVGGGAAPRPESMHLVRFLLEGDGARYAKRFRRVAEAYDHGGASKALFARTLGAAGPLTQAWRAWLPGAQQPWVPIHVEWDPRGPTTLRGTSGVVSACRVRGPARRVTARWVPPEGAWRAGALLEFTSMEAWTVGLVDGVGVRVHRFSKGTWTPLLAALPPHPPAGQPWRLEAQRDGARVTLAVNGAPVGAWDLPGDALGLAIDACRIDFTDLAWTTGG